MKKSMLQAMPALTASQEMKEVAMADEPKKETTYYGHTYTTRTYFAFMNCLVQDGVLKAAFFLPDHLRLDGNNPAYEVFIDKENRQFLTYDHLEKKWRDAKLDRLEWPGRNYYATCWVSEEDAALVQDYFSGERGGDLGILDFQRNVRDEQLERRHKRITDPWDQDLAQVPELPKDWAHWADKVAVRENFIFYHYKRGGAKTGYCTFCGKEVPISGHPYHNKEGRCIRCRHPVVFKALGLSLIHIYMEKPEPAAEPVQTEDGTAAADTVAEAPSYTQDTPMEDILQVMTLEQAQQVIVDAVSYTHLLIFVRFPLVGYRLSFCTAD